MATTTKSSRSTNSRSAKPTTSTKTTKSSTASQTAKPSDRDILKVISAAKPKACNDVFVTVSAAYGDEVAAEVGQKGCRRLPRHGGDHRQFLTVRQANAASKKQQAKKATASSPKVSLAAIVRSIRTEIGQQRGRLSAAKRQQAIGLLMAAVEDGRIDAGSALGLTAKF